MILSVTLNPSVDHALFLEELKIGDTNRVQKTERDAGGKGVNLSRVVAELGGITMATGFIGGGSGAYVRSVMQRQGVKDRFVEVADETRVNFSVEDASGNPPTTFNERGPEITADDLDRLCRVVENHVDEVTWLTLGGSLPPGVPVDIFQRLTRLAHAHGVRVALDADGEPYKLGLLSGPDFIKPNSKEASRVLGRKVETPEDALEAARTLENQLRIAECKAPVVVVSQGEHGAVMACADGLFRGYSPQVEAKSTIGSGDSLVAGMIWAIEDGRALPDALRWGLACGAATATTDGTEIGRKAKILELYPRARVEMVTA